MVSSKYNTHTTHTQYEKNSCTYYIHIKKEIIYGASPTSNTPYTRSYTHMNDVIAYNNVENCSFLKRKQEEKQNSANKEN